MNPAAPELQSDRLHLSQLTEDDAGLMLAVWNDPSFIRHVVDRGIRSEEAALEAMREGVLKLYSEHGYGPYGLSLKSDSSNIGICGLFKRDNLDHPDIGYALLPAYRGQGYALEAARAVVAHAGEVMKLQKLLAIVSPGHARSITLLEKLGMARAGTVRMPGDDEDLLLYELDLAAAQPGSRASQ